MGARQQALLAAGPQGQAQFLDDVAAGRLEA
jgi:hypothetical protein